MHSELRIEISNGIEAVGVVEPALIFTVATLNLAVMARSVWTNQLVMDTEVNHGFLKKSKALAA